MTRASKPPAPPAPPADADVATRLATVRGVIDAAAHAVGRDPGGVSLVAVSKVQPVEKIRAALEAGQRVFGENRVQEAKAKWPALKAQYPDVELHLIGPLQTNKVKDAVALFDVIQTVDRERLAEALAAEGKRHGRLPRLLVEVNTGEEPQKAGIAPADVPAFLAACRDTHGLEIAGLMAIPPAEEEPAMHFALLADLARKTGLAEVSMGMSGDYDLAVRMGATQVRVGTALFGERVKPVHEGAPEGTQEGGGTGKG
ncbi:YggS family pyridoxal phosphate-dependent enzyme [Nitrospirillum sp. BR 11828]|uniref:YggS family pyridoxal phosphate-dependent enzyme n=1 Tax=Nitrospirillum sp. BR 11828 TaxID=3104325 RepID=UPI002ACA4C59|nr:YggS family pyridoxal phosphate-dependent enzyme [Nitrospirillum sp. BR 11828]MDZ5646763.1 YggS family pyridoxal phosphate-dependent enzyme [Nitrospirillum sp. BR 11828]